MRGKKSSTAGSGSIVFFTLGAFCIFLACVLTGPVALNSNTTEIHPFQKWIYTFLPKRVRSRLGAIWDASTLPIINESSEVELGRILLKSGDPSGAEAICQIFSTKNDQDVNAWTCLGESRLALHQRTWKSALTQGEIGMTHNHLRNARENFQTAIALNPTHPEARLGLGICLFLLGTRSSRVAASETQTESTSQLLFDSVLHLNAAAALTTISVPGAELLKQSNQGKENIHLAALYNAALVYMALGDTASAIPLFKKAANLAKALNRDGIIIPEINLGAALLQRGIPGDAISLIRTSIETNCRGDVGKVSFLNDDHVAEIRRNKVCSIMHNNLVVAEEMNGSSKLILDKKYESSLSLEVGIGLGVRGPAFANSVEYNRTKKRINRTAPIIEERDREVGEKHVTQNLTFVDNDIIPINSQKDSLSLALEALENAALRGGSSKQWTALSRAKLHVGDTSGAVETGVKALNAATDVNEVDASTKCIEKAVEKLERERNEKKSNAMEKHAKVVENSDTVNLRLEKDILALKLQLLQRSSAIEQISNYPLPSDSNAILGEGEETLIGGKFNLDIDVNELGPKKQEAHYRYEKGNNAVELVDVIDPDTSILKNDGGDSNPASKSMRDSNSLPEKTLESTSSINDDPARIAKDRLEPNDISLAVNIDTFDEIALPSLYNPEEEYFPEPAPASLGYMKVANAYFDKENYKLASKQFMKVMKKVPTHIPAILGYATSLEKWAKPKQLGDVIFAYANVTEIALKQGNRALAEASFRKSLSVIENIDDSKKVPTLRLLSSLCFTYELAADINYQLGMELIKNEGIQNQREATVAFHMANELKLKGSEKNLVHSQSLLELGRIKLISEHNATGALYFLDKLLGSEGIENELTVKALVLSGDAKKELNDNISAVDYYERAIGLPSCFETAKAHYGLGLILKNNDNAVQEIERQFEMALNIGMDVTPEILETLGESNIAVIKSIHQTEWKRYQQSQNESERGGIMSGSNFSSESVFAPKTNSENQFEEDSTLTLLEQGAVSYDGSVPTGEEADVQSASLQSNKKSSLKAKTTN